MLPIGPPITPPMGPPIILPMLPIMPPGLPLEPPELPPPKPPGRLEPALMLILPIAEVIEEAASPMLSQIVPALSPSCSMISCVEPSNTFTRLPKLCSCACSVCESASVIAEVAPRIANSIASLFVSSIGLKAELSCASVSSVNSTYVAELCSSASGLGTLEPIALPTFASMSGRSKGIIASFSPSSPALYSASLVTSEPRAEPFGLVQWPFSFFT